MPALRDLDIVVVSGRGDISPKLLTINVAFLFLQCTMNAISACDDYSDIFFFFCPRAAQPRNLSATMNLSKIE